MDLKEKCLKNFLAGAETPAWKDLYNFTLKLYRIIKLKWLITSNKDFKEKYSIPYRIFL